MFRYNNNFLTRNIIIDQSNLNALADDKRNVNQMMKVVVERVQFREQHGESTKYRQTGFSPFTTFFLSFKR